MFDNNDLLKETDHLKKFALKLTRNLSDAEDLLQSTLLRAFEKKDMFIEGSNLFAWSSKIMYNLFVSNYRRKAKFESQYDPEPYINNESVEASQEKHVEYIRVRKAINSLSEDQKKVLVLVCIQGVPYEEASEILNIPTGTVRSRLCRARQNLNHIMANPQMQNPNLNYNVA